MPTWLRSKLLSLVNYALFVAYGVAAIRPGVHATRDEAGMVADIIEVACAEACDANCSADRKVDSLCCSADVPRTVAKTGLSLV